MALSKGNLGKFGSKMDLKTCGQRTDNAHRTHTHDFLNVSTQKPLRGKKDHTKSLIWCHRRSVNGCCETCHTRKSSIWKTPLIRHCFFETNSDLSAGVILKYQFWIIGSYKSIPQSKIWIMVENPQNRRVAGANKFQLFSERFSFWNRISEVPKWLTYIFSACGRPENTSECLSPIQISQNKGEILLIALVLLLLYANMEIDQVKC